jgi:hypothetical protein
MLRAVSVTAGAGGCGAGLALAAPSCGAIDRREMGPGATTAEVRALLGEPREEAVFDRRVRWTLPDCSVILEDGKVVEVRR